MKKYIIVGLIIFGVCWIARCATQLPEASATIRVLDDEGRPVEGANVSISFAIPYNAWSTQEIKYSENHKGLSDKAGQFSAKEGCTGSISYSARKEGCYDSKGTSYDYEKRNLTKTGWLPENPTLPAVLKKIINPVPMYVKRAVLKTPELDRAIGFDFEVGDWVAPYGKGVQSDFIFTVQARGGDMENFYSHVGVSFRNPSDGLLEFTTPEAASQLLSTQIAPMIGYQVTWGREVSADPVKGRKNWGTPQTQNFVFRVRTVVDKDGKIIAANYGKIYGGIASGGAAGGGKPYIAFTYYYNPDPQSRSLEFDPEKNLAKEQTDNYPP